MMLIVPSKGKYMEIWAHRGRLIPSLPGNTLLDFQEAYESGVHGIETDVCFTALSDCGMLQPVIHHPGPEDNEKPRTEFLRLGNFLAFLKVHSKLSCFLELKENNRELIDIVAKSIAKYGLENNIYLTACQIRVPFLGLEVSASLLSKTKIQNPKIKTHIIATFPFFLPALARKYNPDAISFGWLPESRLSVYFFRILAKIVNFKRQIDEVQKMGVKVIGGIVNDEKDFKYFANLGVDGIMTDNAVAAMKFIRS